VGLTGTADDVAAVARQFQVDGPITAVTPVPGGHINDSYRVDTRPERGASRAYLLQRLNPAAFSRPDLVMENVARAARHLARRSPRYPALIAARDGRDWVTAAGVVWRMFAFVPGASVRAQVRSPADAGAAGRAFGELLRLLADDPPSLHETIPGFHDTRARFAQLDAARRADVCRRASTVLPELAAVEAERALADVLPPLLASGAVPMRAVHNDAKIGNVLFDARSGTPLCVIDLDTVMPGTALYDFGDLVRSATSLTPEDEEDLARVGLRLDLFEALLKGYLESAGTALTRSERELLGFAGRLITLEQAVRFLTDHLAGDRYYRIERPGHNLIRARAQLALVRSLREQADALDACIARVDVLA
jgi:Ser/Thr protein kinase RdoA (MazF antagonist)